MTSTVSMPNLPRRGAPLYTRRTAPLKTFGNSEPETAEGVGCYSHPAFAAETSAASAGCALMTKESLVLVLLVAAAAFGIVYVIQKASSNEGDWEEYRKVRLGDSYSSVRGRFSSASDDVLTLADARTSGYPSIYKEAIEQGAARFFIVPSREDRFFFGFDKGDRLVYKTDRTP